MAERILYEFDGFQLDPSARTVSQNGEIIALRRIAFELLLVLVENQGETLSRAELIKRVWGNETDVGVDNKFQVTLTAVRRALGESGKKPRYIIADPLGYKFVADVKILGSQAAGGNRHLARILLVSGLYAALYCSAVFLEIAYRFDLCKASAVLVALLVLVWMLSTSALALMLDRKLTFHGRDSGLMMSIVIFFVAAAIAFVGVRFFLPNVSITQATFPAYTAQAAYLKDTVYFLLLALLFLIVPFHFVIAMDYEIERGRAQTVLDILDGETRAILPKRTIFLRFWVLALVLVIFGLVSIAMTAHLVDNLQPGPYRNLFTLLVYLRGILYFGLGIECLAWYYNALMDLKRWIARSEHRKT